VKQGGAHLTKRGWSKPHTHSNPTTLALFRYKIALYRSIRGLILLQAGLKWEQGRAEPPWPPLTLTAAKSIGIGLGLGQGLGLGLGFELGLGLGVD